MSNVKKVKKLAILSGAMLASLLCAGVLMQNAPVQANAAATANDYAQIQGASVRYHKASEEPNKTGLRFTYTVNKTAAASDFGTDFANVEELGILVVPTALLGEGETISSTEAKVEDTKFIENNAKVGGERVINVGTWSGDVFTVDENGDYYGMFVYIYNMPETVYNQDITCVGYYTLKGGERQYTETKERSIASVARQAYDNGDHNEDDAKKASLESLLLDYTATFNAGEGVASVATQTLEYGKPITATAELDGYDFDFWSNAKGEKVTTVTANETLNANYKKDGGGVTASVESGIAIDYAGDSIVSATLNGNLVEATVSGGKIKIDGSVLANEKSYTLAVKETAYKTVNYKVTTVDTSITREFAPINTSNAKAVSYGTATSGLEIVSNPHGKTGNYFKVTSTSYEPGIKVLPGVSEEVLKAYEGGEVYFEYYIENAISPYANILSTRRDSTPETPNSADTEYYQVVEAETGKWISVKIPVSVFTKTVTDVLVDGSTVTESVYKRIDDGFKGNQHNGKLFALSYDEGSGNRIFYVGNMQLISKETVQAAPLSWQEKETSGVTKGYNYGNKNGAVTITEASAMDSSIMSTAILSSEWYYTYANTTDGQPGIKIATNLMKEDLEARKDQNLYFEFYIDCPGVNRNVKYMYTAAGSSTLTVANAFNAWHMITVPVSYVIEHYDAYTTLSGTRDGLTLEVEGEPGNTNIYVSEMKIMSEEALKANLRDTANFTIIAKENATARAWGAVDRELSVETVASEDVPEEYHGKYFKVTYNSVDTTGLYINPTISKDVLKAYKGGTLSIDYYVTVGEATEVTFLLFQQAGYYSCKKEVKVTAGTWGTFTISVDDLYDNYDDIVQGWTSIYSGGKADYMGKMIAVKEDNGKKLELYLGGFKLSK